MSSRPFDEYRDTPLWSALQSVITERYVEILAWPAQPNERFRRVGRRTGHVTSITPVELPCLRAVTAPFRCQSGQ